MAKGPTRGLFRQRAAFVVWPLLLAFLLFGSCSCNDNAGDDTADDDDASAPCQTSADCPNRLICNHNGKCVEPYTPPDDDNDVGDDTIADDSTGNDDDLSDDDDTVTADDDDDSTPEFYDAGVTWTKVDVETSPLPEVTPGLAYQWPFNTGYVEMLTANGSIYSNTGKQLACWLEGETVNWLSLVNDDQITHTYKGDIGAYVTCYDHYIAFWGIVDSDEDGVHLLHTDGFASNTILAPDWEIGRTYSLPKVNDSHLVYEVRPFNGSNIEHTIIAHVRHSGEEIIVAKKEPLGYEGLASSKQYVSFVGWPNMDYQKKQVFLYDLGNGKLSQITDEQCNFYMTDNNGTHVVFTRMNCAPHDKVGVYDIQKGSLKYPFDGRLTGYSWAGVLGDQYMVLMHSPEVDGQCCAGPSLYLYDLSSQVLRKLTPALANSGMALHVDGCYMMFDQPNGAGGYYLFLMDMCKAGFLDKETHHVNAGPDFGD